MPSLPLFPGQQGQIAVIKFELTLTGSIDFPWIVERVIAQFSWPKQSSHGARGTQFSAFLRGSLFELSDSLLELLKDIRSFLYCIVWDISLKVLFSMQPFLFLNSAPI